ncbi:MAG: hypothetical protein ABIG66_02545, partial [Candidatus Kerfeldbacteria bacterium]
FFRSPQYQQCLRDTATGDNPASRCGSPHVKGYAVDISSSDLTQKQYNYIACGHEETCPYTAAPNGWNKTGYNVYGFEFANYNPDKAAAHRTEQHHMNHKSRSTYEQICPGLDCNASAVTTAAASGPWDKGGTDHILYIIPGITPDANDQPYPDGSATGAQFMMHQMVGRWTDIPVVVASSSGTSFSTVKSDVLSAHPEYSNYRESIIGYSGGGTKVSSAVSSQVFEHVGLIDPYVGITWTGRSNQAMYYLTGWPHGTPAGGNDPTILVNAIQNAGGTAVNKTSGGVYPRHFDVVDLFLDDYLEAGGGSGEVWTDIGDGYIRVP